MATARGFITPSPPSSLWGLWPPLPGVMDSFLVPFVFVRVDDPTLYPALRDAFRLAYCTVGNPSFLVNTRSQSRAIGEVVALVALLSGIALSPELLGRYGRYSKNRDLVSVLRVRTSRSLASPPSPASHALDPPAPYCYALFSWHLICLPGWHPTAPHDSWHLHC